MIAPPLGGKQDTCADEGAGIVNDIAPTPRIALSRHHPVHDPAAPENLAQRNSAGISGQTFGTVLDDGDQETVGAETRTELDPGQAFVVPKGVWHRVDVLEPTHFLHITPGPGSAHRPL